MPRPVVGIDSRSVTDRVRAAARPAVIVGIALVLVGCDSSSWRGQESPANVVAPSPVPSPPGNPNGANAGPSTVFGTAYEHSRAGVRPVSGLALRVHGNRPAGFRAVDAVTDANGHYAVPGFEPQTYVLVSVVPQTSYLSPCSAQLHGWSGAPPLDVHVVAREELLSNGMAQSMPLFTPTPGYHLASPLTGRVTEVRPDGAVPVAGAMVQHVYGSGQVWDPTGFTLTDSDGTYVLCGYYDDYGQSVRVSKDGYRSALVEFGPSWTIDVELVRQ